MSLTLDVVDKIVISKYDKATKIIRLWCVVQLNYRQILGDKAWDGIERLTDKDTVTALSFISGLAMGLGSIAQDDKESGDRYSRRLKELVPEYQESEG